MTLLVPRRGISYKRVTAPTPAGMEKSGTQQHTVAGGYMQVTGFASKSGWTNGPTGDTLVCTGPGVVIIQGNLNLGTTNAQKGVRVKQNGTVIYVTTPVFTTGQIPFTVHANGLPGDVFIIESYCNITTEFIQPTTTYVTLKEQVFALTTTHSDDFNRANADIDAAAAWDDAASLAKPTLVSNQITGTSDNDANTRGIYEGASPSAARTGQFFKLDIVGIGGAAGNRVGLIYASNTTASSSWAVLTNSTTLLLGFTASTSASATGTTDSTVTVPTVTPPKEMLALLTSDTTADIFIDRKYVATHMMSNVYGLFGGLYVNATTDIVDNYSQGTWAA